jgi:nucleoid DNA-binding protein
MARKKAPAKKKSPAKKKKAPAKKKKAPAKKKAAARRAAAKRAKASKPKAASKGPITKKLTKSGILNELAAGTGLARKQIGAVLDELESLISRHISKRGVGEFALPGLLKVRAVKRPATKKREGRNPATGEVIMIPAKPASIRVRVTALKRLKGMVG